MGMYVRLFQSVADMLLPSSSRLILVAKYSIFMTYLIIIEILRVTFFSTSIPDPIRNLTEFVKAGQQSKRNFRLYAVTEDANAQKRDHYNNGPIKLIAQRYSSEG